MIITLISNTLFDEKDGTTKDNWLYLSILIKADLDQGKANHIKKVIFTSLQL